MIETTFQKKPTLKKVSNPSIHYNIHHRYVLGKIFVPLVQYFISKDASDVLCSIFSSSMTPFVHFPDKIVYKMAVSDNFSQAAEIEDYLLHAWRFLEPHPRAKLVLRRKCLKVLWNIKQESSGFRH